MRLPLLLLLAAFVFSVPVSAQRTVKAWYQLTSGERVEMVQAERIIMHHSKDGTQVEIGRREIDFSGPVAIAFHGTGPEPTAYSGRSGSTGASGSGQHTEVEVIVDFEGNSTTRTTTTTTDQDTGSQTTTTTTTTTTSSGETTTETTTETK